MTSRRQRTAAIVGTGLIGTSAGLALREAGWRVVGYDRSSEAARTAATMGGIEQPGSSVRSLAGAVDLVIVAVPPASTVEVCRIALDAGAPAVTDVASVKGPVVRVLGEEPRFLGGHPMAGCERGGPAAAKPDLFDGATWVLTQTAATDPRTVDIVTAAVNAVRAHAFIVDAATHDRMVAASSHVPHVLAAALALALADAPDRASIARVVAGGWRSGTRVAAGDPDLWTEILASNAADVIPALDVVSGAIAILRETIRSGDAVSIRELLRRAADLVAGIPSPAPVPAAAAS